MAASLKTNLAHSDTINWHIYSSGARTNFSLNVAYVHNTSGTGIGIRYQCPTADTIDELYVFMDAFTGTLGNITMACDIYNESAVTTRPGTTARDSSTATAMPNAADKWIKFTFGTPYTPTVGEVLWFVFYNTAAAPGTDFPQIMTVTNLALSTLGANANFTGKTNVFTTAAGFSAAGTVVFEAPFVVKQGSNYFGQPYTQQTATYYTSNTLKRGLVVSGVTEDLKIFSVDFLNAAAAYNGIKIFDSATGPDDAALRTENLGTDANEVTDELNGAKVFDTDFTMTGGSAYKAVLTFGSASQLPVVAQIEDYSSYSAVFDELTDGLNVCHACIDNGANGWTIDKSISPSIVLFISSFPAIAGGGAYVG
jgi:hypothetical protein